MSTLVAPVSAARILVVDDELGPRESLRMLLKPSYQVQTADGGRTALEQLPTYRPDVVILDIKMPEMDGLEVLREIKRTDPTIEVVMITAYASLETVKLALTHGAFEYLIKPFSRQDLEDVVRRALLRRQAELGTRGQVTALVEEMRRLASKTRELEEAARREAVEQSLRVTQLSILREISRGIVGQLDTHALMTAVIGQLQSELGYDSVAITAEASPDPDAAARGQLLTCVIRDADGPLGYLVVDNRRSGRSIDPRERELLEMLSEFLAIALRNARLYGEITETKRSLEQLIDSAGDAIISVTPDDRVDGWNPAAEKTFGLAAAHAIGRPITDFLPATDYTSARSKLAKGVEREEFDTTAVVANGSVQLAVTLSGLRDHRGELEGLIAIVRDVTAQRAVESQLHQSEKLAALGQLAGGIAHDFNNLLQAILGYAQLMKQDPTNVDLIQRSLNVVEAAAIDGSETVRRIQQFARLRPDEQFVRVDLNQVVQDAVAITRPRWEEKIAQERRPLELRLDLAALGSIEGRPAALSEALTNLILNAIDAMPAGGTLAIATRDSAGHTVTLVVSDTGVGMPDAVRQRIFEPFFSTKGEAGSGLGLAMTYSIVRRHGGTIRVDSEPGRGTTFTLVFPSARADADAPAAPDQARRRRTARVLLIDDEAQVLETLTAMLQAAGHVVTPVASGAAALAAYAPGRFDVVLTNVGMAEMNGWEFAESLRRRDRDVPLLFITGWGMREDDAMRLDALGVARCLFKPVRPEELDAAIQSVVAGG